MAEKHGGDYRNMGIHNMVNPTRIESVDRPRPRGNILGKTSICT